MKSGQAKQALKQSKSKEEKRAMKEFKMTGTDQANLSKN